MTAPFEASRIKLERATEHLENFEQAALAYLREKPCAIIVERFPGLEKMGTQSWNARIRLPVPTKFSALIGDVVHNLRTALDLLVCDLVVVNGKSPSQVYFPFCASASDLRRTIRNCNIARAGSDVVRAIEALRPYKDGNIVLRAIHDMDVTDKHCALLPVLGAVSVPLGALFGKNIPPSVANWSTVVTKDGQMVIGIPDFLHLPLGTEIPARFFLALDFGSVMGNRPVIEGLYELAQSARSAFLSLTSLRPGAVRYTV